jgi:hypothetical protein
MWVVSKRPAWHFDTTTGHHRPLAVCRRISFENVFRAWHDVCVVLSVEGRGHHARTSPGRLRKMSRKKTSKIEKIDEPYQGMRGENGEHVTGPIHNAGVVRPVVGRSRRMRPLMALVALAGGLVALAMAGAGVLPSITNVLSYVAGGIGLLAVVLGVLAARRIAARPLELRGRKLAVTGALLGVLAVLASATLLALSGLAEAGYVFQQLG